VAGGRSPSVALDLTRGGLHNVKVYHVLDGSRIERVVDPRWLRSNLFRDTRDFIFQHSLVRKEVQRLHLCVVPSWPILQLVHQLPPPAFHDFRKAWRALEATHATRLAPQLIAFDYHRGRIDVASATVYLHRSITAARPRRAKVR
jgi:hypothetical protein